MLIATLKKIRLALSFTGPHVSHSPVPDYFAPALHFQDAYETATSKSKTSQEEAIDVSEIIPGKHTGTLATNCLLPRSLANNCKGPKPST